MWDIKNEVRKLHEQMVTLRRDFHAHPELGLQEFRTSGIVETSLKELGLDVHRCYGTGVIGVLYGGKPGRTVMLRADMDALPVREETGLPFASLNPGVMHACGHDGHTAMLLTAARILSAHRSEIAGSIVFLFQTNEEDAGAEQMIQEGALENPRPDAVFGLHLWSPIQSGKIGLIPGPIMASSYYFKLTIHGQGGHGGAPHTAINPIDAAGHVLSAIKTLHTLEFSSLEPTVISVCKIHGGEKQIVVPDTVEMEGSIRCLHDGDARVHQRFRELVTQVCAAYRCSCDIEIECGNTLLNNDPVMTDLVRKTAVKVVGPENIQSDHVAVMLGDDFAEFTRRIPGAYFFVGVADERKGTTAEHHTSTFNIDEDALDTGVEMEVTLALDYLGMK